ncbi:MAG: outer membrane protein assembly factor BamD [Acidobacteria bacterium]|nr:outer membrane protein assembly factor BamD [Acidobacteriota bacterium]
MRFKTLAIFLVTMLSLIAAACGGKDKVKNENAAIPGRDKELYEQASEKAQKGRYDESRLLYNVVITTYADSEYLPLAKLAIADSFYLEGGTSNLEQAIGGYKDFAQYFPTHPKICDVKHKIAQSYMRQMGAYNRDASNAKKAEQQLKAAEQSCQNSPMLALIKNDLSDVQQVLGLQNLDIAKFYMNNRQAYKAGESRLRDIINNFPFFSYFDETLYLLGVSLVEQEQPEEAAEYFSRLVRDFPNSEFTSKGKEYLTKLGKPIPAPANDNPAPQRPNFMGKFGLILGQNGLDITKDGVLLSKKGDEKEEVKAEALRKPSDSQNATGTRSIRANTRGVVDPATPSQPVPVRTVTTPPDGAATPAATETDKSKTKDSKDKKEKKKKNGLLGIFK